MGLEGGTDGGYLKGERLILSPADLRELTDAIRSDAQARELEHMGIPFKTRRDGTLVVLEADIHGSSKKTRQAPPALRLP